MLVSPFRDEMQQGETKITSNTIHASTTTAATTNTKNNHYYWY